MSELQADSEKVNTFAISRYSLKIVSSLAFGAAFHYFQEIIQPHLVGYSDGFCCERYSNILYDQAQPIYAVCAGIVFFALTFFNSNIWKSILKINFICFNIFQSHTVFASCKAINGDDARL